MYEKVILVRGREKMKMRKGNRFSSVSLRVRRTGNKGKKELKEAEERG